MIQILIALAVIVAVAYLILKGFKAEPVLLAAGLILIFITMIMGWGEILPKKATSTGITLFDPFEVIKYFFSIRAADLGMMIMALIGFAKYMDHIGANKAVVRVATKPLRSLKNP